MLDESVRREIEGIKKVTYNGDVLSIKDVSVTH
jgi:hypothetical protein